MDGVGKVKYRGTLRQFVQIAFGREHIYLIRLQTRVYLVHGLALVGRFKGFAHVGQPCFYAAAPRFHAFVAPVGRQSVFCHIVHALCADLYFHPFPLRSHHGDVKTLIAVAFRDGEPVAESLGIGLVPVGDEAVHLPARCLLFVAWHVEDDTDGKQVVNAFKVATLFFHLLPDGVDALRAPFHVVGQTCLVQHLGYGLHEAFHVFVARPFRGVEFFFNVVIGFPVQVFQGQVLQLAFYLVESQFVSQGCIEPRRFFRRFCFLFRCLCLA